jgi:APA family basic amino acid/polyamine antiporter
MTPTLERRLGTIDAAAIVIANVIGVGIFTTPGIVAAMVPHAGALLALWIFGGLLAFAGAMAYAELAVRFPRAGGEYVYFKESYGPLMAFLTGWTSFVAGFSGAIAAGSVGCAVFLGYFFPWMADTRPLVGLPLGVFTLAISSRTLVAMAVILVLSAIHARGLQTGRVLQNGLAAIKVSALLGLIAVGLASGRGSLGHLAEGGTFRLTTWTAALIPVMFSYSGWNAATYLAEEIRDPSRNVPRALGLGTLIVAVVYLGLNVVYLFALPIQRFDIHIGQNATAQLLGAGAASGLTALSALIMMSSVSAMIVAGPRVYYAMARDGLFFAAAAHVHPRFRTPRTAIFAQALWSCGLVLTGAFGPLLTYTGFAVVLFAGIAVASLFVTRRRFAGEHRAFSAWGYPLAPAIFCVASLMIVLSGLREQPLVSFTGLAIISAGIPLFYWVEHTRRSRSIASEAQYDALKVATKSVKA